jgi:hypothetical protein
MDTSSVVIMGDAHSLDTISMNYTQNININDSAAMLIHADTNELLDADILALREIQSAMSVLEVPNDKPKNINHHLKRACEALTMAGGTGTDFSKRISLTIWNYEDMCYVGVPGGMREVGETPLECALKEATEEAGLVFTNANMRVVGAPVDEEYGHVQWEVFLHTQSDVNQYFIRAITVKFDDDAGCYR